MLQFGMPFFTRKSLSTLGYGAIASVFALI